jgi:hypothetical protein
LPPLRAASNPPIGESLFTSSCEPSPKTSNGVPPRGHLACLRWAIAGVPAGRRRPMQVPAEGLSRSSWRVC